MADERKKLQDKDFTDSEGEIKPKKKRRKTIGEEGSRKQTAIGLLVTLGLGLMFYLPKELNNWWRSFNQPETITILKPVGDEKDVSEALGFKVKIKQKTDVETVIEQLLDNLSGSYGIEVENLKTGNGFSINGKRNFEAASLSKMPVLVEYYKQVDEGTIDPEEIYVLQEKDRWEYGTGSMQNQPVGTEYTFQEVARLVANQSDNMGAQLMSKWVNENLVEKMTVEEAGKIFKDLYNNELISQKSKQKLFKSLTETVNEERIPAGVPSGVTVVHKFGSETGVVNDCGIVYADTPYVICMMSEDVNDGEAEEALPKISRAVWEWISQ